MQELEALKDMLLQKLEEQKELFRQTNEDFEFTKKKLNTEKKVKIIVGVSPYCLTYIQNVAECTKTIETLKEEMRNAENTINVNNMGRKI